MRVLCVANAKTLSLKTTMPTDMQKHVNQNHLSHHISAIFVKITLFPNQNCNAIFQYIPEKIIFVKFVKKSFKQESALNVHMCTKSMIDSFMNNKLELDEEIELNFPPLTFIDREPSYSCSTDFTITTPNEVEDNMPGPSGFSGSLTSHP